MDKKEQGRRVCKTCDWYYAWFGVCCNGDSEYCADCPPYADEKCCDSWKPRREGRDEEEAADQNIENNEVNAEKMKVVVEKGGFLPVREHEDDAGLDLKSPVSEWVHPGEHIVIDTLLRIAIPKGYVGLITSKSGLMKKDITVRGTVDSGYTGTVGAIIFNHGSEGYQIKAGDKICQMVILPIIRPEIELVDALEPTERGDNGYGSTGR